MSSSANGGIGDPVESKIIDVMRKKDYSLDTVNNYGDNLLHMSAANGFYTVIKEILENHDNRDVNLQNDCGWTPLMQAIRNGNVETVKLLLANGCSPEQSKFKGISAIALAVAMGREMFEIVYEACPSALLNSKNYNISPLCVAAMKDDKELFFRLLELGLKISEAGDYTILTMAQSNVPEIAKLGESHHDDSSYWYQDDLSIVTSESSVDVDFDVPQMSSTLQENEKFMEHNDDDDDDNVINDNSKIPRICISPPDVTRKNLPKKNFFNEFASKSLVSPRLEYTREGTLAMSPNFCFARREIVNNDEEFDVRENNNVKCDKMMEELNDDDIISSKKSVITDRENRVCKFQLKRPPNLQISKDNDSKGTIKKTCSISPNKTPIETRYNTPPRELALDIHQKKMAFILKRFGLTHFIRIFLEQEVDLDLFLSLNDQDLQEIGIEKKSDRLILKSVIDECNRNQLFL